MSSSFGRAQAARVGVLGAAAFLLSGCTAVAGSQGGEVDARVLLGAVEASASHSVSLREVYGSAINFDRAVVVCPYMTPHDVEQALGFSWQGAGDLPLENEGRGSLVLASGSQVAGILVFDRIELDLCASADGSGKLLTPTAALSFCAGPAGWILRES